MDSGDIFLTCSKKVIRCLIVFVPDDKQILQILKCKYSTVVCFVVFWSFEFLQSDSSSEKLMAQITGAVAQYFC